MSLPSNDLLLAQNVQPKAGTPGVAQDPAPAGGSASSGGGGSPLAGFMPILMMLVIFVPFFLLMSRRQKKEASARASLKKGDRVMTNAGLVGELMEMDDKLAKREDRAGRHGADRRQHGHAVRRAGWQGEVVHQGIEGSEGCFRQEVTTREGAHLRTCPTRTSSPS